MKSKIFTILLLSVFLGGSYIKLRQPGIADALVPILDSDGKSITIPGPIYGPGVVAVGGMVAVVPNIHANAWQPPESGVIKDGFMRADGATISAQNVADGCVLPVNTQLPNMVGQFPLGSTSSGGLSGSDTLGGIAVVDHKLTTNPDYGGHTHPASTTSALSAQLSTHTHSVTPSVTVDNHTAFGNTSAEDPVHTHDLSGTVMATYMNGRSVYFRFVNTGFSIVNGNTSGAFYGYSISRAPSTSSIGTGTVCKGTSDAANPASGAHSTSTGSFGAHIVRTGSITTATETSETPVVSGHRHGLVNPSFVSGNDTSLATHTHTLPALSHSALISSPANNNIPLSYDVVWVIRVK